MGSPLLASSARVGMRPDRDGNQAVPLALDKLVALVEATAAAESEGGERWVAKGSGRRAG
jgi:hypothetical protein